MIEADRANWIIGQLHERGVLQTQLDKARLWILYGDPCRYRRLSLSDFFPTDNQMDSLYAAVPDLDPNKKREVEIDYSDPNSYLVSNL